VDIDALEREFGGASVWVTDTARYALSSSYLSAAVLPQPSIVAPKRDGCDDLPGLLCVGQSGAKEAHERRLHWPGRVTAAGPAVR